MAIKIYDIDRQKFISVLKDCHLCGSSFTVPLEDSETICPKCKELWQAIIKERREDEGVKGK